MSRDKRIRAEAVKDLIDRGGVFFPPPDIEFAASLEIVKVEPIAPDMDADFIKFRLVTESKIRAAMRLREDNNERKHTEDK